MSKKIKFLVILTFSIIFVLLPQIARALNYDQIGQIAKEITVLIDGCDSGSGFIYQSQDSTYYVVTAKHVFDNSTVGCLVIAPDGTRYDISSQDIIIPNSSVDLAVVSFSSENDYEIASFGDSQQATSGKTVYVAGAPAPSAAIPQRTILTVDGNIVGRQSSQEGYELIYNNPTSPGMSGGAVLNTQGQVIGIHGQGDRLDREKTGLNLAIPIETFINSDLGNLPQPLISNTPEEPEEPVEVNYTTLENQLQKSAWKEANDTTAKILLQLVGREDEGWFSKERLAQLPCNDLQFTDSLWQKYSQIEVSTGFLKTAHKPKFGFSIQKTLFDGSVALQGSRNDEALNKFSETIGWRKFKFFSKNYDEITYNLNAPNGHLPVLPGVLPLATINDVPASIKALESKSGTYHALGFFVFVLGLPVVIVAFLYCRDQIQMDSDALFINHYENRLKHLLEDSEINSDNEINNNINDIKNYLKRKKNKRIIHQNIKNTSVILGLILIVLIFNSCSKGFSLQNEFAQKKQQHFDLLNKNRPIDGSKNLAGIEPWISTLERCEFPNLNNQK